MWNKQDLNLPELEQDVLIFFPDTDDSCRKDEYTRNNISSDKYGRVIIGYFYLTSCEKISITDGVSDFGYVREGIKWAEYNRPSQPDKYMLFYSKRFPPTFGAFFYRKFFIHLY